MKRNSSWHGKRRGQKRNEQQWITSCHRNVSTCFVFPCGLLLTRILPTTQRHVKALAGLLFHVRMTPSSLSLLLFLYFFSLSLCFFDKVFYGFSRASFSVNDSWGPRCVNYIDSWLIGGHHLINAWFIHNWIDHNLDSKELMISYVPTLYEWLWLAKRMDERSWIVRCSLSWLLSSQYRETSFAKWLFYNHETQNF